MIWKIPNLKNKMDVQYDLDPDAEMGYCKLNSESYIKKYGGELYECVLVYEHERLNLYQLIKHYIVKKEEKYIDCTIENSCILPLKINKYNMFIQTLDFINKIKHQEVEIMYYIYCYLDPDTKIPMYVGKGKQNRAYVHLEHCKNDKRNKQKTRFLNKCQELLKEGKTPDIIFLAQNIEDESVAYKIEEDFIKKYGRIGYEENGILLNVCINSNPPNHKGKTYKEIYGDERGELIRLKKADQQKKAGGWFKGKKHTNKAKKIISENTRKHNLKNVPSIEEYDKLLKEFVEHFNYIISSSKLSYWLKLKNVPNSKYRFPDGILEYCVKNFKAKKEYEKQEWYYNPITKKHIRIAQWKLDNNITKIPEGFIKGRCK